MFRLIRADPPAGQVQHVTFVPFLPDGRCVLIERPDGPALPAGEVLAGEDYLIDTVLRVPLQTAGFRYQRLRPFGLDGGHLYAWIEGAPYHGDRPHADAALSFGTAEQAATRLQAAHQPVLAAAVMAADGRWQPHRRPDTAIARLRLQRPDQRRKTTRPAPSTNRVDQRVLLAANPVNGHRPRLGASRSCAFAASGSCGALINRRR